MMFLLASSLAAAQPFDANLIYFILVDRFADGAVVNDQQPYLDTDDIAAFHGGDLYGIINKADHLDQMGVDALWLSQFEMRHEKFMGHGAIHGYWLHSADEIEPFFGGEKSSRPAFRGAHKRDWKLLLDMVYNHVSFDSPLLQFHPTGFTNPSP